MKQIPIQLFEAYGKPSRSTCYLIKIVDRDGVAHGFACLDSIVRFDDGEHNLTYYPDQELLPQNISQTAEMDVDNTQLKGWFGGAVEQLVVAGRFRNAKVTIYRVMYTRPDFGGEIVAYGRVGEIEYGTRAGGTRKVEYRSLKQQLKQHLNPLYSLTCRAEYGDEDCGKAFVWHNGTVLTVTDQFFQFRLSGVVQPANYFSLGVINILDGDNAGLELEVETWAADGWLTVSIGAPYPITVGTAVRIRQDCDKTATTCKARGNILNMRAEHLTPVEEQSIMVPGAYIKSENSG